MPAVEALSTSVDGRLYLARRADAFVLGELDGMHEVARFPREQGARDVLLLPDSRRVVVDGFNGTLEVQEVRTRRVLRRFENTQKLLALDADGTRVFSTGADGLMVRELETGRTLPTGSPWIREMSQVSRVEILGDDWVLVSGEPGSFVTHLVALQLRSGEARMLQKNCSVRAVWPMADRRRVIVLEQQGPMRLWDVAAGEQVRTLSPPDAEPGWAAHVEVDDTGRRLLALSDASVLREITIADGKSSAPLKLELGAVVLLDANRRAVLSAGAGVAAFSADTRAHFHTWPVPDVRRLFRLGTRWFAATTRTLVLLEGERPRAVWEGGSSPTAVCPGTNGALLVGTEDGAVNLTHR